MAMEFQVSWDCFLGDPRLILIETLAMGLGHIGAYKETLSPTTVIHQHYRARRCSLAVRAWDCSINAGYPKILCSSHSVGSIESFFLARTSTVHCQAGGDMTHQPKCHGRVAFDHLPFDKKPLQLRKQRQSKPVPIVQEGIS